MAIGKIDNDLEFLKDMSSSDLDDLFTVLAYGSPEDREKDNKRLTESITSSDVYKKYAPDHIKYVDLIIDEFQRFGGNSIVNMFRGGGVPYKEILCDVCDKMKVNYNKKSDTLIIEQCLFMKIFSDAVEKMSEAEIREVAEELNLNTTNFTATGLTIAMQIAIKNSGFFFYKWSVVVANAVWKFLFSRGLSFGANQVLTKTISVFAGPIGWILTGGWVAFDIASPAYRVTVPAVVQIVALRQKYMNDKSQNDA